MFAAVDIGGTKTLLAVLDKEGGIIEQIKFPTPKIYDEFKTVLEESVAKLSTTDFHYLGIGVPGVLDRKNGIAVSCGNLGWKNEPVERDLERIFHCPAVMENDAKMAGLSEALNLGKAYGRVLYLTFSTGIGIALIDHGQIDINIGDRGGRGMLLEHKGKLQPWEVFASGKAIYEKYGKRASDINDEAIWKAIVRLFAAGMIDLIAVIEPDVIVIGGGVGTHFSKFGPLLIDYLKKFETPLMPIPPIVQAKHAEEAVIYGCYELAKQSYAKHR